MLVGVGIVGFYFRILDVVCARPAVGWYITAFTMNWLEKASCNVASLLGPDLSSVLDRAEWKVADTF